ncbi:uncharacterized protein LOC144433551 [Glandiceps talaboti]
MMQGFLSPRRSDRLPTYSRAITRQDKFHLKTVRSEIRQLLTECEDDTQNTEYNLYNNLHEDTLVKTFTRIYTKDSIKRRFPLLNSVKTLGELLTTLELRQLRGEDKTARAVVKRFYKLCTDTIRDLQLVWDKLVDICKALNTYFGGYVKFNEKANTKEMLDRITLLKTALPVKCKDIAIFIRQQEEDDDAPSYPAITQGNTSGSDLFGPILEFYRIVFEKMTEAFDTVERWLQEDENYFDVLSTDRDEARSERRVLHRDMLTRQRELAKLRIPEDVKSLGRKLELINAEIKRLEDDKNSLLSQISHNEKGLESCKVKRMKLNHELESNNADDTFDDDELIARGRLSKEITKLARKATELENSVVSFGFRLERVKKQLQLKKQERDALEFKYRRLTGLELRRKELQKRIQEIQSELRGLDRKVDKLDDVMVRKLYLVRPVVDAESLLRSLGSYGTGVSVQSLSPGNEFKSPSPYPSPSPGGFRDLSPILPAIGNTMSLMSQKSHALESTFQYLKESLPIGREWPNIFRRLPWPRDINNTQIEAEIHEIRKGVRSLKEQAYRGFKKWESLAGDMVTKENLVDALTQCKLYRIAEVVTRKTYYA